MSAVTSGCVLALNDLYTVRYPHVKVCSQLMDAHLYLMKRWVLDYLADKKYYYSMMGVVNNGTLVSLRTFSSVKGELIPHLVHHQRQSSTNPANQGIYSQLLLLCPETAMT